MFNTPIAIFTFNRPLLTERLLGILAQVKPRRILVVSDGPRPHLLDDVEKCAQVRRLFDNLSWECRIDRNFAASNMGSFPRNSSGLDWVFEQVEEAIILEDDCIPDLSFFPFCQELLVKYRNSPSIGLISGNNFLSRPVLPRMHDYFFTGYALTWGWASWRRTWNQVDLSMPYWPDFVASGQLRQAVFSPDEEKYWRLIFDEIHTGTRKNAWDYQLILACMRLKLLTVAPSVNLVSNVGFGPDATHCKDINNLISNLPVHGLKFPLAHPGKIHRSPRRDYQIFQRRFYGLAQYSKFRWKTIKTGLYRLIRSFT